MNPTYQVRAHTADSLCPLADEHLIQACLLDSKPRAFIWSAYPSLVVPRSYTRFSTFNEATQIMKNEGWPVFVRQSGGGVVPQLSGILNVSLCWADYGRPLDRADETYLHLCGLVQQALSRQGLQAEAQAVEGSFCDGRYNLAVKDTQGAYQKIVGTAQYWSNARSAAWYQPSKRQPGDATDWHVVLAHALILMDTDLSIATAQANKLERLLKTERRYDPKKIRSLRELHLDPDRFQQDLFNVLTNHYPPAHHLPFSP